MNPVACNTPGASEDPDKELNIHTESPALIYQVHQHAVDTGISDLAAQHDHYLYGVNKEDNG
jgi:hypothetical protein